jgi:predicted Rossmann fold nucleotide-binding protein DprA/Smf involved in DNA uptake
VPAAGAETEVGDVAAAVLARLRDGPLGADELARATGLGAEAVAVALSELELSGIAVAAEGVYRVQS